ncbi:MAG: 50S ribosomal protein L29 [Deltaproteobacteria bacterium RIFCSPLOWO2_02_FULL_53_8]|nr:MAG: 50S ribosomal protein L29 [Deltaproteobacteria bacterium RIFCSPLOWO2_02_FULL_53_8]
MKTSQIREMSGAELKAKEAELRKELFSLRMRHTANQLENPLKLRFLRREVAQVKTIIAEKERKG